MARQLLGPVDGSPKPLAGPVYAVPTYSDDEITVLSVTTPHDARKDGDELLSRTDFEDWFDEAREEADDILDEVGEPATDHGAEITTDVDVGEPWRSIVEYAEENDIDDLSRVTAETTGHPLRRGGRRDGHSNPQSGGRYATTRRTVHPHSVDLLWIQHATLVSI